MFFSFFSSFFFRCLFSSANAQASLHASSSQFVRSVNEEVLVLLLFFPSSVDSDSCLYNPCMPC